MKPHEIEHELDERMSGEAGDYWAGADRSLRDEMVVYAQRHGIDAAEQYLIDSAAPGDTHAITLDKMALELFASSLRAEVAEGNVPQHVLDFFNEVVGGKLRTDRFSEV